MRWEIERARSKPDVYEGCVRCLSEIDTPQCTVDTVD